MKNTIIKLLKELQEITDKLAIEPGRSVQLRDIDDSLAWLESLSEPALLDPTIELDVANYDFTTNSSSLELTAKQQLKESPKELQEYFIKLESAHKALGKQLSRVCAFSRDFFAKYTTEPLDPYT